MKLSLARTLAFAFSAAILASIPVKAQTPSVPSPSSPNPDQQQSTPDQPAQNPPAPKPAGKVLFERSLDANGNTVNTTGPAAKPAAQPAETSTVADADRKAIAITSLDLDVRLNTPAQQLAARALVTVRNAGTSPLTHIPLQISSSLNWERIRIASRDLSAPVATINSDSDHTGQLHEAVVSLAQPLAPGATIQLDVTYSGTIAATARRLLSVGTPEESAAHSDWDEISPEFTGLRGFGNVVWYPVSSTPVIIGDGARLFDEIGNQKLHAAGTAFRLRLTVEFPHGHPPTIAVINGHAVSLKISDPQSLGEDVPGIATADTGPSTLAFESPSLFVATRTAHPGPHLTAYTAPEDESAVKEWLAVATNVAPMIERWLGPDPRTQLTVLDLPDPDDLPWESGPLLAIPVRDAPSDQLAAILSHALTHAWMAPEPYWLNEGTANFMGTLWDDHQHHRDRALATLEAGRQALALAEPPSPGEGAGQPLAAAISPVYYRTKAAYILWMLRDLVGDDALAAALRASNAAESGKPANAEMPSSFQALLKAQGPRNLNWLFADWIDADHGLPDLTIDRVFPNAVQSGNWLTSVTISNAGYAAAQVPVTVRSATNNTTERVFVPAHGTVTPRILVQGKPIEVQLNDGTVPETQASVHVMHLDQKPEPDLPAPAPK
ncbi:hypothetical protein P8935_01340 [Telmatobacter sp. DSM 110680]|uniref:Peptidase M1 membrane alanine aminopeptidase domain-containing protein n=1 Tax=Telmatobacter sp. DSM 110680 TaxID=3036704 RepID=A0AAU7DL19_9BACT